MINLRFTFVKIIVIQPSGCKGNFNKLSIYLSIYPSIYLSIYLLTKQTFFQLVMNDIRPCFSIFATLSIRIEHPVFQCLLTLVLQIFIPNRLISQAGVYNVYGSNS